MSRLRRVLAVVALIAVGCTDSAEPEVIVETTLPARAERTTGFDGEIVSLAVLADLSGPGAGIDRERVAGVETFWSAVNASGGLQNRYAVQLVVLDHGGDPARAVTLLDGVVDDVVAVAFVSESVVDAVGEPLTTAGLLAVPAVATASNEVDATWLAFGLPVEAALVSVFDGVEAGSWCVVADQGPLGARVAAAALPAAQAAQITAPGVYEAGSAELGAVLAEAGCDHVYVEVGAGLEAAAMAAIPAERTVVRRATVGYRLTAPDGVAELLVDDGPAWTVGSSTGMDALIVALAEHSPDADPDPRLRAGYTSQLQLEAVLSAGFDLGDVRRPALAELRSSVGRIDMGGLAGDVDRSVVPAEYPRQLRLFSPDGGDDGLGWSFVSVHRAPQVDVVLSALVAG